MCQFANDGIGFFRSISLIISLCDVEIFVIIRNIPYDYEDFDIAETYYEANAPEKANTIISKLAHLTIERLDYYVNLPTYLSDGLDQERQRQLAILSNCVHIAKQYQQEDLSKELDARLNELINRYSLSMK